MWLFFIAVIDTFSDRFIRTNKLFQIIFEDFFMLGRFNITLIPFLFSIAWGDGYSPTVKTGLGLIVGSIVEVKGIAVNQFLSIPYAKPPIGKILLNVISISLFSC